MSDEEWKVITRRMLKAWMLVGLSLIMAAMGYKAIENLHPALSFACCGVSSVWMFWAFMVWPWYATKKED
jgi:hypothetical protein